MDWSLECFLLHRLIKMILRTLTKLDRERATALVIMLDWKGQIWNDLQHKLSVSSVVLGKAEEILKVGEMMKKNELKLLPGNLIAIKMTGTGQEKFCSERCG
ncbi:MAG: hypothetical protein EZS28_044006 [Streblomastix strix]|uniref:Uncharacterized protein n=1 Tax=Streblomastix strix TaxID=222440 RepID=A0A5J4TPS8_9EUKA|nr:MAG: hypothetical protein EZS28_044006 [Streblomastix strix]